ncbi:uncharacterized protein BDZ99DRAFT_522997 [Mytilinidion resinicola]|uniref:Uncharacterized protein n=1 Tax=Mytilinidion resinicola TaxID=574789 RepID=A0A6A6YFK4_9PEZI|nr:uncharacterized protein BDZ99DRAFT_522997 [Mytilinidion resinicola]KAF2807379.1 hypothetical protein BDZ99DRAFT_522997 [Mytilinidion resinicola]
MPPKKRTKPNPTTKLPQDSTTSPSPLPSRSTFSKTWPANVPPRETPKPPCFTCGRRYKTTDPYQPTLRPEPPARLPCSCVLGADCLAHHLYSSNAYPKCSTLLFEWEKGDVLVDVYITPTRTLFFAEFDQRCPRVEVERLEGDVCGGCFREWGGVVEDFLREVAVRVPCGCVVGRDCFLVKVRGEKSCPACGRLVYTETEGEKTERAGLQERLERRVGEREREREGGGE